MGNFWARKVKASQSDNGATLEKLSREMARAVAIRKNADISFAALKEMADSRECDDNFLLRLAVMHRLKTHKDTPFWSKINLWFFGW